MKLLPLDTEPVSLQACADLMQVAFPHAKHLDTRYLRWLYADNPAGPALGFNAWQGDKMVGHYAALPVDLLLDGNPARGLLAVNTATHPDCRGAGPLFTLANKTIKAATEQGYACIYAVANAASTPICVHALKFQLVAPLDARIGIGGVQPDWSKALEGNRFRRLWGPDSARWRSRNPHNPMEIVTRDGYRAMTRAPSHVPGVNAVGVMPTVRPVSRSLGRSGLGLSVYLGLLPAGACWYLNSLPIPERFKPSPLNLVYRRLADSAPEQLERDQVILGFQDFDAY